MTEAESNYPRLLELLATIESGLADVQRMVSNTNDQRIPHQHSILTVEMARHCGYLYGLIQAWKQSHTPKEGV